MMVLSNAFYGGRDVMDKNRYDYVLFVVFLSFTVLGYATQYVPKLPYAINKTLEKQSLQVRKNIDEALKKKCASEVCVQLYDPSSKHEYVLIKALWETSESLKGLVGDIRQADSSDTSYMRIPFEYSFDMIPNLFKLIRFYLETDEKIRQDKLKEQITQIDFKTLVSILLLANHLLIQKNIFDEIVEGVRNKIMTLNGINQSCFMELQKMDKDLKRRILADEVWNVFLQEMKIPITRYCFNQRFTGSSANSYIYQFRGDTAKKLLPNSDGSRLLYIISPDRENQILRYAEQPALHSLYVLSLQKPGVLDVQAIRQYPSWINKNQFACLDFTEKNKFILYDCEKNIRTEKVINPPEDKFDMDLYIHDLITSSDKQNKPKVILLYSLYSYADQTTEYGLAIYDHESETIDHRDWTISPNAIKLLFCSNEWVRLLTFEQQAHGDHEYILSFQQLSIGKNNFGALVSYKKEAISEDIKYQLFNCVVSPDGSKIAFVDGENICIQLLDMFVEQSFDKFIEPWIKWSGKKSITTMVFSEDSQMLMVGYEDGTIDAFDIDNGIKIGELLYEKKQAFNHNNALSFSSDGNIFAISGNSFKDRSESDHLLIWKLMPFRQSIRDKYFALLDRWKAEVSLEKVVLCKFICDQSREEKKELKFSDQGEQEFYQLNYEIQEMLTNIGYVASANHGILPAQHVSISESIQPIEPSESPKTSIAQQIKDRVVYYWQWLRGNQPLSSDTKKLKAIQDLEKLMGDKRRYANE